jgi:hypothetical protein
LAFKCIEGEDIRDRRTQEGFSPQGFIELAQGRGNFKGLPILRRFSTLLCRCAGYKACTDCKEEEKTGKLATVSQFVHFPMLAADGGFRPPVYYYK